MFSITALYVLRYCNLSIVILSITAPVQLHHYDGKGLYFDRKLMDTPPPHTHTHTK